MAEGEIVYCGMRGEGLSQRICASFQFQYRLSFRIKSLIHGNMLRFIGKSVLVQRVSWRVLNGMWQSSGAVEMEARSLTGLFSCVHS